MRQLRQDALGRDLVAKQHAGPHLLGAPSGHNVNSRATMKP